MTCNQCGGMIAAVTADVNVAAHPSLSGLMLACQSCDRPIRLLHRRPLTGHRTRRDRAEVNRALRAARRMRR